MTPGELAGLLRAVWAISDALPDEPWLDDDVRHEAVALAELLHVRLEVAASDVERRNLSTEGADQYESVAMPAVERAPADHEVER